MSRIALANMIVGFAIVLISAAAGSFIGLSITENAINSDFVDSWSMILQRSAHGHFNLFGYLHILFGLTIPYSTLASRIKLWQSIALAMGSLAIGPGLMWRSFSEPTRTIDVATSIVGLGLTAALVAIAIHIYGLSCKFQKHS